MPADRGGGGQSDLNAECRMMKAENKRLAKQNGGTQGKGQTAKHGFR
jgi:hypothetical protein